MPITTMDAALKAGLILRAPNRTWWVDTSAYDQAETIFHLSHLLPWDLTPGGNCPAVLKPLGTHIAWHCTRDADHQRRHAAGDGQYIVAVWS